MATPRVLILRAPGANCDADTELTGTIFSYNKNILNRNQLNEVREAETTLSVEVVWKDLRTGEILTRPRRGETTPAAPFLPAPGLLPGQDLAQAPPQQSPWGAPPGAPAPPGTPQQPPVLVQSVATFIPEVGESLATAYQRNVNRLATNIVAMMEKPW